MSTSTETTARILVAEDSPLNQQIALKQLELLGYQASGVSDGDQAVQFHQRTPVDVILMDCQMPGINGYDATTLIRDREAEQASRGTPFKRVYIIAMTANTEADNKERCLASGMDDFMSKPVQLPELDAVLRRAFAQSAEARRKDEIIDPVRIASLRQLHTPGKPEPLKEFIELFLREAPAGLEAMDQALAQNAPDSMGRVINAASALKGSAANLGARRLAAVCEEIEQTAWNWLLEDAKPIVEKARAEFESAREILEQLKQG